MSSAVRGWIPNALAMTLISASVGDSTSSQNTGRGPYRLAFSLGVRSPLPAPSKVESCWPRSSSDATEGWRVADFDSPLARPS